MSPVAASSDVRALGVDGAVPALPGPVLASQEPCRGARRARASSVTAGMCCRSSSSARTRVNGSTWSGRRAEFGLAGAVHILGYVSDEELIALYQHAHALLYLSRFGPENLPPLEAFALGCPAIVEDVCGCKRAVRRRGADHRQP